MVDTLRYRVKRDPNKSRITFYSNQIMKMEFPDSEDEFVVSAAELTSVLNGANMILVGVEPTQKTPTPITPISTSSNQPTKETKKFTPTG